MKNFTRFLAIIMTVALLCSALSACSGNDEPEEITTFRQYISDSNYYDAGTYYTSTISSSQELIDSAKQVLIDCCDEIAEKTLSGEYSSAEAQSKLDGLQKMVSQFSLVIDGFDDAVENVHIAITSKAAFSSAIEFEAAEDYEKAATYYQSVVAGDSNYSDAQNGFVRCAGEIKKSALADASMASETGDSPKAIVLIRNALAYLPEDSELLAAMSGYETSYLQTVLTEADGLFMEPSIDYSAALSIINAALKVCPDHATLSEKRAYYSSFVPVNLYDLEPIQGTAVAVDTDSDADGNGYEKCFQAGYSGMEWNGTDVSFNIGKSYHIFSACVYGRSAKTTAQNLTVRIYGDGELLYEKSGIADNSKETLSISVDVTGVSELRIVMERDNGAISKGIGMTDMLVQKTAK